MIGAIAEPSTGGAVKSVAAVAALVLLVGCGPPETGGSPRPVPDAAAGEQITLFTRDDVAEDLYNFGISGAFPLPDGTVLLSYDLAAENAGDETPRRPRLAVLAAHGELQPIDPPVIDGVAVEGPGLLALGPDGTAYLSEYLSERDGRAIRILARSPDDSWRVVPADLDLDFIGNPVAAVGPDGALYVTDDDGLHRMDADGSLETVVGISRSTGSDVPGAPPLPADQPPVPARDVVLSDVWGLAVGPDGTVFASNRHEIVAIDPGGVLTLVTTLTGLQDDLGLLSTLDPPFLWSELAIDADGSLLVSDGYQQLIADLEGPEIIARHAMLVTTGQNASLGPHHDLLLRLLDPEALQAGPSLPDQLAAFGR